MYTLGSLQTTKHLFTFLHFCIVQELVDLCSAKGSLMVLPTILFLSTGVLKETAAKCMDPVEVSSFGSAKYPSRYPYFI